MHDWHVMALLAWMAFVLLGAMVAFWHVFVTHAEHRPHLMAGERNLIGLMKAREEREPVTDFQLWAAAQRPQVRRALGSKAVLPNTWKETAG